MDLPHVDALPGVASCSDPEMWPVVDAAFAKPGGDLAHEFRRKVCTYCPIHDHCLAEGIAGQEKGVWGGTSPNLRARLRKAQQAA